MASGSLPNACLCSVRYFAVTTSCQGNDKLILKHVITPVILVVQVGLYSARLAKLWIIENNNQTHASVRTVIMTMDPVKLANV